MCSKEWFYKSEEKNSTLQLDQTDIAINPSVNNDTIIPPATEELISEAEQDQKINLSFNDDEDSLPSKSEMDENLDRIKAERKKKKKSSISQGTRTRLLFYLLIILILALVTVSIPYKDNILAIFPELSIVFEGLTPLYEIIFK